MYQRIQEAATIEQKLIYTEDNSTWNFSSYYYIATTTRVEDSSFYAEQSIQIGNSSKNYLLDLNERELAQTY
jgi:archaellum component FlaF (FlaF/FlaG flagellin family)